MTYAAVLLALMMKRSSRRAGCTSGYYKRMTAIHATDVIRQSTSSWISSTKITRQIKEAKMAIKCDKCPRCKDVYPGKLDSYGYHYHICGMGGNIVYTTPHKIKKACGKGWLSYGVSGCGLYDTVEDALQHMTDAEKQRLKSESC